MTWVFLIGAILSETGGTLSLRMASKGGGRAWLLAVAAGFVAAFAFLTLALDGGMPLGVAYGIWAAAGVALTAITSRLLFHEPLTKVMALGIGLIIVGVLFIELGAAH
ncbi:DMT family transporter [Bailinhaonella thermotolerans]|uniref:QacE family quaternary ammonium compound efflux SMR transporter n=1 Tax=Bailinhaonella thermotolerans TaxID=1070861 RepID=A0A3A4ARX5_9ACTN|nr:SMR family transporter [Bailinhaonella thermotolerans]RJL32618.1 QacE family quaternary ammonium compound efflux SMR transporter [Bailinhaonella thermotolerans]